MKTSKRLLALVLAFLLAFGSVPTAVFADEGSSEPAAAESAPAPAPAPTAAPAPKAEPKPEPKPEPAPAESASQPQPEAQPETEAPAPEAPAAGETEAPKEETGTQPEDAAPEVNENTDKNSPEESDAPDAGEPEEEPEAEKNEEKKAETFTVIFQIVKEDGERIDSLEEDFKEGEALKATEKLQQKLAPLAEKDYDLVWHLDSKDGRKIDLAQDVVKVTKDMTVVIVAKAPEKAEAPEATAEPEAEVYTLTVDHILSAEIGAWGMMKFFESSTHEFTAEQLAAGVDTASLAKSREGMVVTSAAKVLTTEDFTDGKASITINYGIADGYVAVYTKSFMLIGVYSGNFDDVEIKPEKSFIVSLQFVYEDGTVAAAPVTVAVSEENALKWSYTMDAHPDDSYTVQVTDDFKYENGVVSGAVTGDVEIIVTFIPQKVDYTVKFREEKDDGSLVEIKGKDDVTQQGVVGQMTNVLSGDVVDLDVKGFEMQDVEEIKLEAEADKNVVTVTYERLQYSLNYDTNGGSYVEPKVGKYQDKVDVYTETQTPSGRHLSCGMEEHTHSWECNLWWSDCPGYVHTHSDSCYTTDYTTTFEPTPTKKGYTFDGWYMDEDCTQKANPEVTLDDDVTVYAKWIPGTASYTIVYMKELLDENNASYYVYYGSATGTATIDSTVTATRGNMRTPTYYKDPVTGENSSAVVKADGSTVVYMYYNLKEYTYTFTINNGNATLTKGGTTYTDKGNSYTLKVKLGMNIADKWPTKSDFTPTNQANRFNGWDPSHTNTNYVTKRYIVTEEMLPSNGDSVTFTGRWGKVSSYAVEYYLQNADGNGYTKSTVHSETFNSSSDSLSAKEIAGYKHEEDKDWEGNVGSGKNQVYTFKFYYTRNQYSITFKYQNSTLKTERDIYFDADITGQDYEPTNPTGVDSDWEFAGWYDNAECLGDAYTFGKMPSNDLVLYAKFVPPTYTVTFHSNYPDGTDQVES